MKMSYEAYKTMFAPQKAFHHPSQGWLWQATGQGPCRRGPCPNMHHGSVQLRPGESCLPYQQSRVFDFDYLWLGEIVRVRQFYHGSNETCPMCRCMHKPTIESPRTKTQQFAQKAESHGLCRPRDLSVPRSIYIVYQLFVQHFRLLACYCQGSKLVVLRPCLVGLLALAFGPKSQKPNQRGCF